jgi:hypothetical protein
LWQLLFGHIAPITEGIVSSLTYEKNQYNGQSITEEVEREKKTPVYHYATSTSENKKTIKNSATKKKKVFHHWTRFTVYFPLEIDKDFSTCILMWNAHTGSNSGWSSILSTWQCVSAQFLIE